MADATADPWAPPFAAYEVWAELDRNPAGPGWLTLWRVEHGSCLFFARDAAGNNRSLVVEEGETARLPGLPGCTVELLGCRPRGTRSRPWAAVRLTA